MRDEDDELIACLTRLTPAADVPDAAAIAYEAGRRAGRRSLMAWRSTCGVLVGLSVAQLAMPSAPLRSLTPDPAGPAPIARHPSLPTPERAGPAGSGVSTHLEQEPAPPAHLLRLRDAVLAGGPDVLPATSARRPARPLTVRDSSLAAEGGPL